MSLHAVDRKAELKYTIEKRQKEEHMMKNTLITDRTFLSLSILYPPDKRTEFENSLMRDGCWEAFIVWNDVISNSLVES